MHAFRAEPLPARRVLVCSMLLSVLVAVEVVSNVALARSDNSLSSLLSLSLLALPAAGVVGTLNRSRTLVDVVRSKHFSERDCRVHEPPSAVAAACRVCRVVAVAFAHSASLGSFAPRVWLC
jgi:hypothetical protein